MAAKVIYFVCAQALFVQIALSQCLERGTIAAPSLAAPACGSSGAWGAGLWGGSGVTGLGIGESAWAGPGYASNGLAGSVVGVIPTSGGALSVSSVTAIAPVGISVDSENAYEGALEVTGQLPFVSTVGLEGVVASAGTGVVNHGCGSGIAIAPTGGYGSAAADTGRLGYGGLGNSGFSNVGLHNEGFNYRGLNYGSLGLAGISNAGLGCGVY